MEIRLADKSDLDAVYRIVQETIKEVYTRYYPEEAVAFFSQLHSPDAIEKDLADGCVWLVEEDGSVLATGTVRGNGMFRAFVLPEKQGQGIGTALFDHLEKQVALSHTSVQIDASLPSFNQYFRRGYRVLAGNDIPVENDRILFYIAMEKVFDPLA